MKKTYIILLAVLLTSISYSQKVNGDKTGFVEEISIEIDKDTANKRLKAWAEKRYVTDASKLFITDNNITSKGFISMAFRARQGKMDHDMPYKFYYNIDVNINGNKVIVEVIPTEIDFEMTGERVDNSMYEYLIVDEKIDIDSFEKISFTVVENSDYPNNMKKKMKKAFSKNIETFYKDCLVNMENYKLEVKAIFDSAKRALSAE